VDIGDWFNRLSCDPVRIEPYGDFPRKQIEYYYRKFLLLKKSGYFSDIDQEEILNAEVSPEQIRSTLANIKQITLEVTDICNLKCEYCGYGKFYSDYDKRENKSMDFRTAKRLLDYFADLWNSSLNQSHDRNIYISFYGGEPLLNYPLIREVASYANQLKLLHNRFTFSMTTNGLLIEKYMDFLVEYGFRLLISLDGEKKNNAYRVFANGKAAYPEILRNVEALQKKYPDYFKNNVNFNAVLHNKNSVSQVFNFFKRYFDKTPFINALNTAGIRESEKQNFWQAYSNVDESLFKSKDYLKIEKEMFIRLPNIQNISKFVHYNSDFSFTNYNDLIFPTHQRKRIATGTCVPFSKKVYVTVNGKIMPCERIGHQFFFGYVRPDKIELDEEAIAKKFNDYIRRIRSQCNLCYNTEICTQCVFNLNLQEMNPKCFGFMTYKDYSKYLSSYMNSLEQKPETYAKLLKEVVIE
jgi:uncharacterized protein